MTNENAIINFCFFAANFPHDFIQQCWKDEPHLIEHLKEHFASKSDGVCIDSGAFLKFYFELSRNNQRKLAKWITENYLAFQDLKN